MSKLTKLDKITIAQLRKADKVIFYGRADYTKIKIELKDATERVIEVNNVETIQEHRSGFSMISSAQYCATWLTVARHLKPGDEIKMEWKTNYYVSNFYLRHARGNGNAVYKGRNDKDQYESNGVFEGLYADTLRLYVCRAVPSPRSTGIDRYAYTLDTVIAPDLEYCRMLSVRRDCWW